MTRTITSAANPKVKRLVRLRNRRHREAERVFLVEGFRELGRAAEAGARIDDLFVCEELFLGTNEPGLVDRIVAAGARLHRLAPVPFRKAAYRDRPEGLLAVAPQFETSLDGLRLPEGGLVLVVEAIEKPGNLGTMLRTADAAGAAAVVVADPATDPFNPNVVRASLGSLFTVPLAVGTATDVMAWIRERCLETFVTSPSARLNHWEVSYLGSVAVVIGSEQYGLTGAWLDGRYPAVRIPMGGTADSLNASTAAAIVLFEAIRQRSVHLQVDRVPLPLDA
ncbi:MAG: RNA methyltransferase [bacterium]|nr:RNA methyltransferase [bacterium]MDE0439209.1 RNA methyltransferase [bacterium]